jgi:hypothetical protein
LDLKIKNIMGEIGDVLVRNNLTNFTFENSDTLKENQLELVNFLIKENDSFFAKTRGVKEITLLLMMVILKQLKNFSKMKKLHLIQKNQPPLQLNYPI